MNNDFEVRGKETAIFMKNGKGETVETLISTIDLEKVRDFIGLWYPAWSPGTKSYYVLGYGGKVNEAKKNRSLHRWIMDEPENLVVDHVNHDTLNNCFANLRIVSQSVNALNRRNTGVVKYKDRWKAQFTFEGEKYNLGTFDTEEEARTVLEENKEDFISFNQHRIEADNDEQYFKKQVENGGVFN